MNSKMLSYTCLAVIMGILLFQSGFSLFWEIPEGMNIESIDIILRTSLSSLFGLFISLMSSATQRVKKQKVISAKPPQIGFTNNAQENYAKPNSKKILQNEQTKYYIIQNGNDEILTEKVDLTNVDNAEQIEKLQNVKQVPRISINFQILVVSGICVYCLVMIIFTRNFSQMIASSTSAGATISQYRDFLSGGIGALIGLSRGD